MRGRAKQAEEEAEMLYRALAAFFRGKYDLDRHPTYILAAFVAGASSGARN